MNLIKVSTQFYPYTISELRRDYPNVSFPSEVQASDLIGFDAAEAITDPAPVYDELTEKLEPLAPTLINDVWRVQWQVISLTQQEVAARLPSNWAGFNADILIDNAFNTYFGVVLNNAPAIATSLPAALTQVATQGLETFELVFTAFCQVATVTTQDRQSWANLAVTHNLPTSFVDLLLGV